MNIADFVSEEALPKIIEDLLEKNNLLFFEKVALAKVAIKLSPKKVQTTKDGFACCPSCKETIWRVLGKYNNYCQNCGQKIQF